MEHQNFTWCYNFWWKRTIHDQNQIKSNIILFVATLVWSQAKSPANVMQLCINIKYLQNNEIFVTWAQGEPLYQTAARLWHTWLPPKAIDTFKLGLFSIILFKIPFKWKCSKYKSRRKGKSQDLHYWFIYNISWTHI